MISGIKGMNDVYPRAAEGFLDAAWWDHIYQVAAEVLQSYGYAPVWLPVVEDTALFTQGLGEATDIVSKEMYSFTDRGGRALTLRPEGTAGAARAYVEHHLGRIDPVQRWWYAGPMFRAERPQMGRYRQFYQLGAELLGCGHWAADAEMLLMLRTLCIRLGIPEVDMRINTLGDAESRQDYRRALCAFLQAHLENLCESCRLRQSQNPLRALECKNPLCQQVMQEAPSIDAFLSAEAAARFEQLRMFLKAQAVALVWDPRLVRGLDYYTGFIFELTTPALGAQDSILGGGRYDHLVASLGGPATPAVGFAAGVERLALLLSKLQNIRRGAPHLYILVLEEASFAQAFGLAEELRRGSRWQVEVDVTGGRIKQQMRRAARLGAWTALAIGPDELQSRRGRLKNLRTSQEDEMELSAAALHAALSLYSEAS